MIRIISQILEYEKLQFLPEDVTKILHALIKFKKEYDSKARSRAAPRINSGEDHTEAEAAVYPNLHVHSMDYRYAADNKRDETDDSSCNKEYNESPIITGGITHISCKHSIYEGVYCNAKGGISSYDSCPHYKKVFKTSTGKTEVPYLWNILF